MLDEELTVRRWSGQPLEIGATGKIVLQNAGIKVKGDELIAHGWIDIDSINLIRVDEYQREILSKTIGKLTKLQKAVAAGVDFTDITLGMRGDSINFPTGSSNCKLLDPVYVVDGLQRISAIKQFLEKNPDRAKDITIGAEVRFSTDKESETALFHALNANRTPVSPNVILRNLKDSSPGVMTLYGLTGTDKNFALYRRVCWHQRMVHGQIMSATVLARVAHSLHADTQGGTSRPDAVASLLDGDVKRYKMNTFRENLVEFFDILDACYGVRSIELGEKITHVRANFMTTLARVFQTHENFWRGQKLHVDAATKKKLATFPVNDPEISRLVGAGHTAVPLIENYLLKHLNKGKKTNRLVER